MKPLFKIHKRVVRSGVFGGTHNGPLCGRLNKLSTDGMNISDEDREVTCAFCRRRIK